MNRNKVKCEINDADAGPQIRTFLILGHIIHVHEGDAFLYNL